MDPIHPILPRTPNIPRVPPAPLAERITREDPRKADPDPRKRRRRQGGRGPTPAYPVEPGALLEGPERPALPPGEDDGLEHIDVTA